MYGSTPYATTPYAALGGIGIIVSACIHVDSQLLYTCDIAENLVYIVASVSSKPVYTCDVASTLVYTVSVSGSVCPCDSSGAAC